jgi:inorganic triphosphatase YgiF
MSAPREIELKLEVPPDYLPRLTEGGPLKRATPAGRNGTRLVSVYFDTDKLKLRENGLSLRVRRIGGRLVQTIKRENGTGTVLFARDEWEHDIPTRQPDLDAVRDTGLGPLRKKKLRRTLRPVFETRVRRKVFDVQSGDSKVEVAIDRGSVEAGRKSSPICELELELKQGRPADLFRLAKTLAQDVPVRLAVESKADRGYALLGKGKPRAVKAAPVALAPDLEARSAFQIIARACLHQAIANQPVMLHGDPDGLHQMRVGLRRLRAAISLFSNLLGDQQTKAVKAELKWIMGELGPARELEIFLTRVVNPAADGRRGGQLAVLAQELQRRRKTALARARTAADSDRLRTLCLDLAAWIEAGDWTESSDDLVQLNQQQNIALAAAEQLQRRRKKIVKRGRNLARLDGNDRHRLRIDVKKLRYAAEFFAGAFPRKKQAKRWRDFAAALERLQDALGDLNDIRVHEQLSEQFIERDDSGGKLQRIRTRKAFAAGRLSGREEARLAPLMHEARQAYAEFTKVKPFWG